MDERSCANSGKEGVAPEAETCTAGGFLKRLVAKLALLDVIPEDGGFEESNMFAKSSATENGDSKEDDKFVK